MKPGFTRRIEITGGSGQTNVTTLDQSKVAYALHAYVASPLDDGFCPPEGFLRLPAGVKRCGAARAPDGLLGWSRFRLSQRAPRTANCAMKPAGRLALWRSDECPSSRWLRGPRCCAF